MAVISVRLNTEEERILRTLTDYFHVERSTLLKKSMYELYEDIQDIRFIEERIESKKNPEYITVEELFV